MDREQIFQSIKQREFAKVVQFLKSGPKLSEEDPITQHAITIFFDELLNSESSELYVFQQLFMLHSGSFFHFSEPQIEIIVRQLCSNTLKIEEKYFYAQKFPHFEISKQIIDEYVEQQPKELEHSKREYIKVQAISSTASNLMTSIFNSKQERLFFYALQSCFPHHYIYPNAALSTIVNVKFVQDILGIQELKYFYASTIDFVVIDQFNDFKPVMAIELDSEWHRQNNQEEKDKLKNKIFINAGLSLYRIEHLHKFKTVSEFAQVILETVKK